MKNEEYEWMREYFLKDDFIITMIFTKKAFIGIKNETKGNFRSITSSSFHPKFSSVYPFLPPVSTLTYDVGNIVK